MRSLHCLRTMKFRDSIFLVFLLALIFGVCYLGSGIWTTNPDLDPVFYDPTSGKNPHPILHRKDKNRIGRTQPGWKPGSKHMLLDIEELHVKRKGKHDVEASPDSNNAQHTILYYNNHYNDVISASGYTAKQDPVHDNAIVKNECVYSNCVFTRDLPLLQKSSAVIFQASTGMGLNPPARKSGQVWVLSDKEQGVPNENAFSGDQWKYAFNWTISYKLDADIFWQPGTILTTRPEHVPNIDYYKLVDYRKYNYMAYVDDCARFESSTLKNYTAAFKKFADLHIYGACAGLKGVPYSLSKTATMYKAYVVLDDFSCPEFIAKEFYDRFKLRTLLIVRGKQYDNLFPKTVVFDASIYDTKPLKKLAEDLDALIIDVLTHTEYVRNKDSYVTGPEIRWQCDLCAKLNNLDVNRQVYKSVKGVLNRTDCMVSFTTPKAKSNTMHIVIILGILAFFMAQFWKYCCRFYCRREDGRCRISYFENIDWSRVPLIRGSGEQSPVTVPT